MTSTPRPFPPARLCIYYGWPSAFDGATEPAAAAAAIGHHDVIVLGWGLQERSHGDHRASAEIVGALGAAHKRVYGYIPLGAASGLSTRKIRKAAKAWGKLGVHGVLLDEAGFDYGNTRRRQNEAYDAVHGAELTIIANGSHAADMVGTFPGPNNPKGEPIGLIAGDALLYESYRVRLGQLEDLAAWRDKIERLQAGRPAGVQLFGVSTAPAFDPVLHDHLIYCAILDGLDAVGWGEHEFAAPDNRMPPRPWPRLPTAQQIRYLGPVERAGETFSRRTSLGTVIVEPGRGRIEPS